MDDQTLVRRFIVVASVILGLLGDLLAAAILFRTYSSVFESVAVSLLVLILCSVGLLWAALSPGGALEIFTSNTDKAMAQVRAGGLFYGIALLMSVIKIVLTLVRT